ncbi:MAG: class I SAM-dependent methyltransferase [Croceitalea sp.]|nr:class I SAM-dependent methyltransferase [Croceitalea sp.]
MSNLYNRLAKVYEAMYQSFIDYEQEYQFYNKILTAYRINNVLEIGCGTGNLANYFIRNKMGYCGLDISEPMLAIAQKKNPKGKFIQGDMRHLKVNSPLESIIVTGRTLNYLVEDTEVTSAFHSFFNSLMDKGILCFDFIDADEFIPAIRENSNVIHEAIYDNTTYKRISTWNLRLKNGWDLDWRSDYYKKNANSWVKIGSDQANVRTFTLNEIEDFLKMSGFHLKDSVKRDTYAFSTYVVVAEKVTN